MKKYIQPTIELMMMDTQQMMAASDAATDILEIDNSEMINPDDADSRDLQDLINPFKLSL